MRSEPKTDTLTIRLTAEQRERLDRAASFGPYRISRTDIVARGIELAAQELEAMEAALLKQEAAARTELEKAQAKLDAMLAAREGGAS